MNLTNRTFNFGWLRIGSFQARLLLLFVILLAAAMGGVAYLNYRSEAYLVDRIKDDVQEVTSAVQLSVQQLNPEVASDRNVLAEYVSKLQQAKGVKSVSVLDTSKAVIASTNPKRVGTRIVTHSRPADSKPSEKPLVIEEHLGGPTPDPGEKVYEVTVPIGQKGTPGIGYIHIEMTMDDFAMMLRRNHRRNILVYSGFFLLGLLLSFALAWHFTRPIEQLALASRKVAAGDLSVNLPVEGKDEVARLSQRFNEMVAQLRIKQNLEEEMRGMERVKVMGEMAQGVAHEIRNPLNQINLSVGFLGDKYGPAEERSGREYQQLIADIKGQIARLNALVGNFLELGKPLKLTLEPYRPLDLITEVLSLSSHQAMQKGIDLAAPNVATDLRAPIDPAQMRIALMNLVNNALEATPLGGQVRISARSAPDGPGKENLVLEVADSGPGISKENLSRVFEPYFTTKQGGIGIGLAIAKRIVEDHGGRLRAENRPEGGALFTVLLPVEAKR